MLNAFLFLLSWIAIGVAAIRIFDRLDGHTTDWKSYLCGAITGPAGAVVIVIYAVMMLILKLYDAISNRMKGIK
jgi:amino acid permease